MIELIEANAVDGCLDWKAWDELELRDDEGITWTITSIRFPLFNNVLRAELSEVEGEAKERVEAIVAPFRERDLPFAWWTGPSTRPEAIGDLLEAQGLSHAAVMVGMSAELEALRDDVPLPEGLSIIEVSDIKTLSLWCTVLGQIYNFPELAMGPWFRLHAAMGLGENQRWRHFLGVLDGRPVATSSLFLGGEAASIASIATSREVRNKGIGSAMSLYPLLEARRQGFGVATLCSSRMAVTVYRGLGFEERCELNLFLSS